VDERKQILKKEPGTHSRPNQTTLGPPQSRIWLFGRTSAKRKLTLTTNWDWNVGYSACLSGHSRLITNFLTRQTSISPLDRISFKMGSPHNWKEHSLNWKTPAGSSFRQILSFGSNVLNDKISKLNWSLEAPHVWRLFEYQFTLRLSRIRDAHLSVGSKLAIRI